MSSPGWYPDPAGGGGLRYWDGRAWGPAQPPPRPRARKWPWVVAGVIALLPAVILYSWQPWNRQPASAAPSSPTSQLPVPTESIPSPSSSSPTTAGSASASTSGSYCSLGTGEVRSNSAGRIVSGGLSYELIDGWEEIGWLANPYLNDSGGQLKQVSDTWAARAGLGSVSASGGSLAEAAEDMLECLVTTYAYPTLKDSKPTIRRADQVGDAPAYFLQQTVTVSDEEVQGDIVYVVVVDTGTEGQLAVFTATAVIGDEEMLQAVDSAVKSLRLET